MPSISNFLSRATFGRGLVLLGALGLLAGSGLLAGGGLVLGPARAQNIDEGKSAPQIFAGSCVTCHKSANNLAKGRMTPTLFLFLQDRYTTSKSDAWSLSSYLASVDTSGRSKGTKSASSKKRTPRPPAAVPN